LSRLCSIFLLGTAPGALEKAWSDGYKQTTGHELDNVWFKDLQAIPMFDLPRLLFMTTSANTGRPVALSHVSFLSDSSIDTLDTIAPNIDVRLVTAAIMSARFPIITRPARLPVSEGGRPVRLLAGGYFENSGVTCTLALLREIATDTVLNKVRFMVVRIENGARESDQKGAISVGFSALKSPVLGLYQTGGVRGELAVQALMDKIAEAQRMALLVKNKGKVKERSGLATYLDIDQVVFSLSKEQQRIALPLGWMLSVPARREIADQLALPHNAEAFRKVGDFLTSNHDSSN
jgi:hypothetical protein